MSPSFSIVLAQRRRRRTGGDLAAFCAGSLDFDDSVFRFMGPTIAFRETGWQANLLSINCDPPL